MDAIAVFDSRLSTISGYVQFHQCKDHRQTIVTFSLSGLPKNKKLGCHIHKFGISSLQDPCGSTCDHYNPENKRHGSFLYHGNDRHAGDLTNNIESDANGNVNFSYEDNLLNNLEDLFGRSVVIHSGEDDYGLYRNIDKGSATTGNAGGRIACAVIGRKSQEKTSV